MAGLNNGPEKGGKMLQAVLDGDEGYEEGKGRVVTSQEWSHWSDTEPQQTRVCDLSAQGWRRRLWAVLTRNGDVVEGEADKRRVWFAGRILHTMRTNCER
jgi:hypothetical protein